MHQSACTAALPLVASCLLLWTAGLAVRARAPPPPNGYRVSGNRSVRSLQGLLGFLHGFRLGHGLAQTRLYDLYYHPAPWYPPVVIAAPAHPANQQQIVNLLAANDVGENYQEMNGDNVQVIKDFSEPIRSSTNKSLMIKTFDNIVSGVNDSFADPNELEEINKPRVQVRKAQAINASLADNRKVTDKPPSCHHKKNCTLDHPKDVNTTVLPDVTPKVNQSTTSGPTVEEVSTVVSAVLNSSTTCMPEPEVVYPNRTHPYPNRTSINNTDDISITTDLSDASAGTENPVLDKTYLHTLALPLEDNGWEQFSKVILKDSGFRPIVGNYNSYGIGNNII